MRHTAQNIIFIFDAGIAAATSHEKIEHFKGPFPNELFLVSRQPNSSSVAPAAPAVTIPSSSGPLLPSGFAQVASPPRSAMGRVSLQMPDIQAHLNLDALINSIFDRLKPDLIFVFLSHPDKDHINLVGKIPKTKNEQGTTVEIPAVFFLCGDWLSNPENTKEERDALNYIQAKSKKILYMPYYWQTYPLQSPPQSVTRVEKEILEPFVNDFFGTWVKTQDRVICDVGLGSLLQLLPPFSLGQSPTLFALDDAMVQFLNNIHIWLLNHHRSDINAQSCIVSCTLPTHNMSFVFTGDADDSTFNELARRLDTSRQLSPARTLRQRNDHLIWLSLPHHGSRENKSVAMIDLFDPDAYIATAGIGTQYGHPATEVIESLRQRPSKDTAAKNVRIPFWEKYQVAGQEPFKFFKFQSTAQKGPDQRFMPSEHQIRQGKPPMLCPNRVGCLYMDTAGHFYHQSPTNNIVEYESGKFGQYDLTSRRYVNIERNLVGSATTASNTYQVKDSKTGKLLPHCIIKHNNGQELLYESTNSLDPLAILITSEARERNGYQLTPV